MQRWTISRYGKGHGTSQSHSAFWQQVSERQRTFYTFASAPITGTYSTGCYCFYTMWNVPVNPTRSTLVRSLISVIFALLIALIVVMENPTTAFKISATSFFLHSFKLSFHCARGFEKDASVGVLACRMSSYLICTNLASPAASKETDDLIQLLLVYGKRVGVGGADVLLLLRRAARTLFR